MIGYLIYVVLCVLCSFVVKKKSDLIVLSNSGSFFLPQRNKGHKGPQRLKHQIQYSPPPNDFLIILTNFLHDTFFTKRFGAADLAAMK